MLVPVIVDLAENHWHKILQESLIALKTILKEIELVLLNNVICFVVKYAKNNL